MGIDRALPFGQPPEKPEVIILGRPGSPMVMPTAAHVHP
jgi:hypothetical protein